MSVFVDKDGAPSTADLARALGPTAPLWEELKREVASRFPPLAEEWAWSGRKYGWSLRLKQKKRAVLYLSPLDGHFRVSFAVGEKAIAAARDADMPASVIAALENAPRFPEGRAVRFDVHSAADIPDILAVAQLKMST